MAERPIIFSGPMVRAILEGRKTQTRRVCKLTHSGHLRKGQKRWHPEDPEASKGCPYAVGDRLWVREAFASHASGFDYRADGDTTALWRSPIHMPRSASRITLAVTDIRVQRVQDISEADALAEGVLTDVWSSVTPMLADPDHAQLHEPNTPVFWAPDDDRDDCICFTAKEAYGRLWNSIHGGDVWDLNEWVVAITFERAA